MRRTRWTPYHERLSRPARRRAYRKRRSRPKFRIRRFGLIGLVLVMMGAAWAVMFAGATNVNQSVSPTETTSAPSPSPASASSPQTSGTATTTTSPTGSVTITPQSTAVTSGSKPTGASGGSWVISTIDSSANNTGRFATVSAPDSDTVFVAYDDETTKYLMFAESTDGGDSFTTSILDSSGDAGFHLSMYALDTSNIYIAYRFTGNVLKFIKSTDGGSTFSSPLLIDGSSATFFMQIKALDTETIYIAYKDSIVSFNGEVKFVKSTDGGSTFSSPLVVDTDGGVGTHLSMDLPNSNTILLSYYNATNDDLMFAKSEDSGSSFSKSIVDSGGDVGTFSSLSAPNQDIVFISYYDVSNEDLKFAKSTNGGASFTVSTIDSTGSVGTGSSTVAPTPNDIFIGYRDSTNQDLKLARSSDGGSSFTTITVDSDGDVGGFADLDTLGTNVLFIAYKDGTNLDLKFAKSVSSPAEYTISTVDSSGSVGEYTSIATPDADTIYVSYTDVSNADLKFASSTDSGGSFRSVTVDTADARETAIVAPDASTIFIGYRVGSTVKFARSTNGGGVFNTSVVDSAGDVGQYLSMSAVDANTIFMSYYDNAADDLKLAKSTNGGSSFTTSIVDSGGNVGGWTSIVAVDASAVYIAYQDTTNASVKFAKSTNGGTSFTTSVVDSDQGVYMSMAAPSASTILIAYYDTANADLKLAKSTNSGVSFALSTLDSTGDVGAFASLAAADASNVFIAYSDSTNADLKLARSSDGGSSFLLSIVDSSGSVGTDSAVSAVDENSLFISYQDDTSANLKLAKFAPAGDNAVWYPGTLTLDTDGDGTTDTFNFVMIDLNNDDTVDRVELSSDDTIYNEGTLSDDSTGTDDDERFDAGGGSTTSDDVTLGVYTFTVTFTHAVSAGSAQISATSKTWYTGTFTVDANADDAADDTVHFVLSDSDSKGQFDTMDLSTDDSTFGEGGLANGSTGSNDDERITSTPVKLGGIYTFEITFNNNPASGGASPSAASNTWYTGTFNVDIDADGSIESLDFVLVDTDSDGVYDTVNIDTNDDGVYSTSEVFSSAGGNFSIGSSAVQVSFSSNPGAGASITLTEIPPDTIAIPREGGAQSFGFALPQQDTGENAKMSAQEIARFIESVTDVDLKLEFTGGEEATTAVFAQMMGSLEAQSPKFREAVRTMRVPLGTEEASEERIFKDISGQPMVIDEVVVTLDFDLPDTDLHMKRLAALMEGSISGAFSEAGLYQLRVESDSLKDLDFAQETVDRFPGVDVAARHIMIDPEGPFSKVPDDEVFSSWNVDSPDGNNWSLEFIDAPRAWDVTTGSQGVTVAVIDGDLDDGHADLKANTISNLGAPAIIAKGHGTHVAGTICAEGNNGVGISGVAWQCSMRMYDFGAKSAVKAAESMMRAVKDGARIVNMSLQWIDNSKCGTPGGPDTLKKVRETNAIFGRAIQFARHLKKDVLWVIAAGNECRDTKFASPASLVDDHPNEVLVVGSIDQDGKLSFFSNYGDLVDVAAPGGAILSTLPRVCTFGPDGGFVCTDEFGVKSGTSMAAPHVSGLAVLMRSVNSKLTAPQIKDCIVRTATHDVAGEGFRVIDAPSAVACAQNIDRVVDPNEKQPFGGGQ